VVDRGILRTAQLLLGHPEKHDPIDCDACRAIQNRQWSLALRCAAGTDTPITLAALIELYLGGLAAGLLPDLEADGTETDAVPLEDDDIVVRHADGQALLKKHVF
jgi:hypothetical protein